MIRKLIPLLIAIAVAASGCLSLEPVQEEAPLEEDSTSDSSKESSSSDQDEADAKQEEVEELEEKEEEDNGSQDDNTTKVVKPETWFLFWPSDDDGCLDRYMAREFNEDGIKCTYRDTPTGPVTDRLLDEPVWFDFNATDPTQGHETGTPVVGQIHMFVLGLGVGDVVIELLADNKIVANTTSDLMPDVTDTEDPFDLMFVSVPFQMETHEGISPDAQLAFRFKVDAVVYLELMTSEDQPTFFTIAPEAMAISDSE